MISDPMKDGTVQYGDTFLEGTRHSQKATERRLAQGAMLYSGTKSLEFMQGYLAATKIVRDAVVPRVYEEDSL